MTLVIGFMALLDVTIVNVALPSIREGLGASAGEVQWIVSGYALTFGLTLVAGGRLGDAYGRRRMMLIGPPASSSPARPSGWRPTSCWVVLARLAQGVAAGLLTPQNSGLIQQLFRGPERGRAFGLLRAHGLGLGRARADPGRADHRRSRARTRAGAGSSWSTCRSACWRWCRGPTRPGRARTSGEPRAGRRPARGAAARRRRAGAAAAGHRDGRRRPAGSWFLPLRRLLVLSCSPAGSDAVGRGGAPVLDVALLSRRRATRRAPPRQLYFTGFTGVFLVLSLYLQEGLDLSPLADRPAAEPFALGLGADRAARRPVGAGSAAVPVVALVVVMAGWRSSPCWCRATTAGRPVLCFRCCSPGSAAARWSPRTSP